MRGSGLLCTFCSGPVMTRKFLRVLSLLNAGAHIDQINADGYSTFDFFEWRKLQLDQNLDPLVKSLISWTFVERHGSKMKLVSVSLSNPTILISWILFCPIQLQFVDFLFVSSEHRDQTIKKVPFASLNSRFYFLFVYRFSILPRFIGSRVENLNRRWR